MRRYGFPQSTHPLGRRLYGLRHPPTHGYAAHANDNADTKLDCFAVRPYSRLAA
jgi:hypothetical protein